VNLSQRCTIYRQASAYIAQQAYGPFYFSFAPANIAVKGVTGPGLSTALPAVVVTPMILWEDVSGS
jgi:peptide/nickel transport system substrate-binding protein